MHLRNFYWATLTLLMMLNLCGKSDAQISVLGDSLISKASTERKLGSYDKALQYDLGALSMAHRSSDTELMAAAYNGVATDYYRIGDFKKARSFYSKALEAYVIMKDTLHVADQYYKLGMLDIDEGLMSEGRENFVLARDIFERHHFYLGLADVYNGLASMFYVQQNLDSVAWYAEKALENYQLGGNRDAESFMYINLGALFNAGKNHQKALEYVRKGIDVADSNGLVNQLRQGYKNLSETYAMLADWQNAYKSQIEYIRYKDSIFNQQKEQALREVETRYQTAEKERKIQTQKFDLLQQEKQIDSFRNMRNLLILALIIIVVVTLFLIYRYRARQKMNRLLDEKNQQLEEINAYKDKLFAIISHDLRSPVSSFSRITSALSMAVDRLQPEEIKKYLSEIDSTAANLHQTLRGLLQWSLSQQGGESLSLNDASILACTQSAMNDCHGGAAEKKVVFENEISEKITAFVDAGLLQIVIRNVLSNAIKFSPEGATIAIKACMESDMVFLDIIDSGPGVPHEIKEQLFHRMGTQAAARGSGFGLFISSELLHKMHGEISLLNSSDAGSTFRIILPLHKAD